MSEFKAGLISISIIGVVLAICLYLTRPAKAKDDFKVGDCVERVYKNDFYKTIYYYKILKIGENDYLMAIKTAKSKWYFDVKAVRDKSIFNDDKDHNKVDPKLCPPIGE